MGEGMFYGVGIGPGDPELLTIKAKNVLSSVEVLCVPKSGSEKESLALSIINGVVDKDWEIIELYLPMTQDEQELNRCRREAAQKIYDQLQAGRSAAFITLGDPTLYSTFTYLLDFLRRIDLALKVEIVPGISAVNAVSGWMQLPLAEGNEKFAVVPALQSEEELSRVLKEFDNVMILKAGKQLDKLIKVLDETGLAGSASFACRYGFEDGFVTSDIDSLRNTKQDYLSAMLVKQNYKGGVEK